MRIPRVGPSCTFQAGPSPPALKALGPYIPRVGPPPTFQGLDLYIRRMEPLQSKFQGWTPHLSRTGSHNLRSSGGTPTTSACRVGASWTLTTSVCRVGLPQPKFRRTFLSHPKFQSIFFFNVIEPVTACTKLPLPSASSCEGYGLSNIEKERCFEI